MEQKINKKLVKQLRDGKIAVNNDWTLEKLIRILKKASTQRPLQLHNPSTYYYFVSGNLTGSSHINILKPHSVSDFFKPAKVKLKDVDKPIWFPDTIAAYPFLDIINDYGKACLFSEKCLDSYISYKDINWTKTKSSIEDRVSVLEHYRKETNTILSNIVYKISSPEEQNKIDCLNGIIDAAKDIVKEFKEPEPKEEAIDWSKPQYLVSEKGKVVLSTGKYSNEYFDAIKFGDENYVRRIQYVKKYYKPFKGTITV